ncbi:MAG: S8/S53 family peptidase [Candidatus Aminicenantes bacterium]|nr:S8/S53 family peptidase [Candidatus Aminicenantes bacterium]
MKFYKKVFIFLCGTVLSTFSLFSQERITNLSTDYTKGKIVFSRTLLNGLSYSTLLEMDKKTLLSHEKILPGLYENLMNFYHLIAEMRNPELINSPNRFSLSAELMAQELLTSIAESPAVETYSPLQAVLMSTGYYAKKGHPLIRHYFRDFQRYINKGWAMSELKVHKAHLYSKGKSIKLAIVDSGIDPTWKRIKPRILCHKNFLEGPRLYSQESFFPYDRGGHGTSLASVIYQIAPQVDLMIVKVHDGDTMLKVPPSRWTVYLVTAGILWAAQNGADVINLSMAFQTDLAPIHKASMTCWKNNIIIVSPVANTLPPYKNIPSFPAAYPWTLAIGGIEKRNGSLRIWPYSGQGNFMDVVAPARGIWNATPTYFDLDGRRNVAVGNSLATSFVSGTVALMLSVMDPTFRENLKKEPGRLFNTVQKILRETASNRELGFNRYNPSSGYGIVNIPAAVVSAKNISSTLQEKRKKGRQEAPYFSFAPMRW